MADKMMRLVTQQSNFAGGVDSSKVATMATGDAPQGLLPSQLAWLNNASVRGGGITPRGGWAKRATMPLTAKFQGGVVYEPLVGVPYGICSIGGHIYKVDLETYQIEDLSIRYDLFNPADVDKAFFAQGEEFLVIQAGDYVTLPLFWDGAALVRSRGYANPTTGPLPDPTFTVPAIGSMVLVTLAAPYTVDTNRIFMINGYRYQQMLYTQAYDFYAFANGSDRANAKLQPLSFPAGSMFMNPAPPNIPPGSDQTATTLTAVSATFDNLDTPSITTQRVYAVQTNLTPANFPVNGYVFPNGTSPQFFVRFTQLVFPPPGANEVWLVNLDDPRAGESVVPPAPGQDSFTQLPAAGPMDYYMGRFWLANGREYLAGDIVGGPSGSARYQFRDSILYVEENTFLAGGGTFAVPTNAGNITALRHNASLDTATGEGILFVFTSQSIFSVNVTPVRATWIALEEPLQRVVQINHGTESDRSIVPVNGDLFFRRIDGVGSLITAIRYFNQWANPPLSNEERRVLIADNPLLLSNVSGIEFDSKLWMTCLPFETDVGIAHQGIMPLDFEPIASAREQLRPPWEGLLEGLDILQLLVGNFSGAQRAFGFIVSRYSGAIELWELTKADKEDTNDSGNARITWILETPGYVMGSANVLKELETARIWIDRLYGKVDFTLYWRNDQNACWNFWNAWSQCAARNSCEDPGVEFCPYPTTTYKEQYRAMMRMPKPEGVCDLQSDRPSVYAYSFQLRLVIKGFCRVRGISVYAWPRTEEVFSDMVCVGDITCGSCDEGMAGPPGLAGADGTGMRRYVGALEDPNGIQSGRQGDEYKSTFDGRLWTKTSLGTGNTGWE